MARRGPKPGTIMPRVPHDIITDGKGAVGVLLSNRPWRVWVDGRDFDRIVTVYGNQSWSWVEATRFVRLRKSQNAAIPVARLVVGESGRFIRYGDGDRLNLRRANLRVEEAVRPGARVQRDAPVQRGATTRKARTMDKAQLRQAHSPPSIPHLRAKATTPKQDVQAVGTIKRSRISSAV